MSLGELAIRRTDPSEVDRLQDLIRRSARGLGAGFYSHQQIESAVRYVYGVDSTLIEDGTYFEAFIGARLAGCGGWSQRDSLYGGDQRPAGSSALLRPGIDAARIRAFFIEPEFARQGVATALYQRCVCEAKSAGYTRLALAATLPGVPFYRSLGFESDGEAEEHLPDGVRITFVRMSRSIAQ
jgi:GNAT superfamily N-acetyltransferase